MMTTADRDEIMAEINEDEAIGAALGHDGYCYSSHQEDVSEKLGALTGRPYEVIDGMTILDHIKADIAQGKYRCCCDGVEY